MYSIKGRKFKHPARYIKWVYLVVDRRVKHPCRYCKRKLLNILRKCNRIPISEYTNTWIIESTPGNQIVYRTRCIDPLNRQYIIDYTLDDITYK